MTVRVDGTRFRNAVSKAVGQELDWAIVVAHTKDGWELVVSSDDKGNEFDLMRVALEFQLAIKGLAWQAAEELADSIYGEATTKEETP